MSEVGLGFGGLVIMSLVISAIPCMLSVGEKLGEKPRYLLKLVREVGRDMLLKRGIGVSKVERHRELGNNLLVK